MASYSGYNPLGDVPVSYPRTYSNVKDATFNSAAGVTSYPSFSDTAKARGNRGRGRGGNRTFRGDRNIRKEFTCANKHPIAALKELYSEARFEVICQYLTSNGAAIVVTTTINGIVYQGEGTNGRIARTIAAHKALSGMNASGHEYLAMNVDLAEQKRLVMERITKWQEDQAMKEAKKADNHQIQGLLQASKKVKDNNGNANEVMPNTQTYGTLIHRYGPDIIENTIQLEDKTQFGTPCFQCSLTVQGSTFTAVGTSKKSARNDAVRQAFDQFTVTPPPIVNEKKLRKTPKEWNSDNYKPIDPVEVQDIIAKKCWDFVTEQIASITHCRKMRRNLVCIVQVDGELTPDNCEVVAFGNGTLVIKKENMSTDGTAINDSTGESLALRALRRYLLDQLELCLAQQPSIYVKDKTGGKCSLRPEIQLLLYTNSSPMGDCRVYNQTYSNPPSTAMDTSNPGAQPGNPGAQPGNPGNRDVLPCNAGAQPGNSDVLPGDHGAQPGNLDVMPDNPGAQSGTPDVTMAPFDDKPINTTAGSRGWRGWRKKLRVYRQDEMGLVSLFVVGDSSKEETPLPRGAHPSHSIVSPSDKLAMRQMVGVQGSILFSLSHPVFISQYLINRSFNEEALNRAVYSRVKDAEVVEGPSEGPVFKRVMWKATSKGEPRATWSLIWAKNHAVEIIHSPHGKQFPTDEVEAPVNVTEKLAVSEYCTKSLYTAHVNVCKRFKRSYPQKYSVAKYANTRYRKNKNSVIAHLRETGMGEWSERECKPDF